MDEQRSDQRVRLNAAKAPVEEPLYTGLRQAGEGVSDVVTQLLDDASNIVDNELEQSFLAIRKNTLKSRLPEWFKPGTSFKRPAKAVTIAGRQCRYNPGALFVVFLTGLLIGGVLVGQWLFSARLKTLTARH